MNEIVMKNIFSSQIIITVQELNFHNMKQPSFDLVMPLKEIREEKEPKGLSGKYLESQILHFLSVPKITHL